MICRSRRGSGGWGGGFDICYFSSIPAIKIASTLTTGNRRQPSNVSHVIGGRRHVTVEASVGKERATKSSCQGVRGVRDAARRAQGLVRDLPAAARAREGDGRESLGVEQRHIPLDRLSARARSRSAGQTWLRSINS